MKDGTRVIKDLTKGNETKAIIYFAIPMIIGNLFQQLYNIADSIIVGKTLGADAFAAVGASFTIMVFLTSIILGLCMGSGVLYSHFFGAKDFNSLKKSINISFFFILLVTLVINVLSFVLLDQLMEVLNIPLEIIIETKTYLKIIFLGIGFTFIYNFFSSVLRSMGNSFIPLMFLIVSAVLNIILDIIFIIPLQMGVAGAAWATVIAQGISGIGVAIYSFIKFPLIRPSKSLFDFDKDIFKKVISYSLLASIQQSIMNFGILMIQGLVNSFGVVVMAAFSAAVKVDSFAYMPVQDFGNAFSTYIAQNEGAGKHERIEKGIKSSVILITLFCFVVSVLVIVFRKQLISIFVSKEEVEIINLGAQYLLIVSSFYFLIGYLFMLYGLYRGRGQVLMSIILTIISLGTRVALAFWLSKVIGVIGIWWSIPIGWFLADSVGFVYYLLTKSRQDKKVTL